MKYKNILEEIKSFQEEIPKKSAKIDFTDKISDAKIKIDALYNFAFYDLEYKVANYNKLLVDYGSRREKNKKHYLITILFNDLSKLILQDVNEYKEKQKYITELINFFKRIYAEITNKKCEIYRYA